eukprot:9836426-Prorocentrum_lima.AAC.1
MARVVGFGVTAIAVREGGVEGACTPGQACPSRHGRRQRGELGTEHQTQVKQAASACPLRGPAWCARPRRADDPYQYVVH